MKVIFSHGQEGHPQGHKIQLLSRIATGLGLECISLDYRAIDCPEKRVAHLENSMGSEEVLLVGSSMGGYVSVVASEKFNVRGMFLMAPALYMNGFDKQSYGPVKATVVHGRNDTVVPLVNSVRFAKEQRAVGGRVDLRFLNDDHRLGKSDDELVSSFNEFLFRYAPVNMFIRGMA